MVVSLMNKSQTTLTIAPAVDDLGYHLPPVVESVRQGRLSTHTTCATVTALFSVMEVGFISMANLLHRRSLEEAIPLNTSSPLYHIPPFYSTSAPPSALYNFPIFSAAWLLVEPNLQTPFRELVGGCYDPSEQVGYTERPNGTGISHSFSVYCPSSVKF